MRRGSDVQRVNVDVSYHVSGAIMNDGPVGSKNEFCLSKLRATEWECGARVSRRRCMGV